MEPENEEKKQPTLNGQPVPFEKFEEIQNDASKRLVETNPGSNDYTVLERMRG